MPDVRRGRDLLDVGDVVEIDETRLSGRRNTRRGTRTRTGACTRTSTSTGACPGSRAGACSGRCVGGLRLSGDLQVARLLDGVRLPVEEEDGVGDVVDDHLSDALASHRALDVLTDRRLGEVLLGGLLLVDLDLDDGLDGFDVARHRLRSGHILEALGDLLRGVLEDGGVARGQGHVDGLRARCRALVLEFDLSDTLEGIELPLRLRADRLRGGARLRVDDERAAQPGVVGEPERRAADRDLVGLDAVIGDEDVLDLL